MPPDQPTLRRDALLVGALHTVLALVYWLGLGVSIVHDFGPDPWGWFSQNLSTELLRERAAQSIWHMHGQPPLWNVLGAVLIKIFDPVHMQALQVLHIAIGATTAGLCLHIVARSTGNRWLAIAAGLVIALHPALYLYEAYALYTLLAAFLVTVAAYMLVRAESGKKAAWAVGFVAVVVALVMTRSIFHILLLVPCIALALVLLGRPSRKQLLILSTLVLLPLGWYGKNLVQHGFFGASSWYGMGMWRTALFRQSDDVLQTLFDEGSFEPVVRLEPFSLPSAYRSLGYDLTSSIPVLAGDDHHNINVPRISRDYRASALALVRHTPGRYLRNVLTGYGNFSAPSTDFAHLADNRIRIGSHARLEQWILGRPVMAWVEQWAGGAYFGSFYFVLFPVVLLAFALQTARAARHEGWALLAQRDSATLFMGGIVLYTIVLSCVMELGENVRFKFMIEPVFLTLTAVVGHRLLARRTGAPSEMVADARQPPRPIRNPRLMKGQ